MGGPWESRASARLVLRSLRKEERLHYDAEFRDFVDVDPEADFRLERRPRQDGWEVTS